MKRTALTQIQLNVLEEALLTFGDVVTASEIESLIPSNSPVRRRQLIKQMADAGWLVRIKRGLYQIADLSSLGMLTLSRYAVAQLLTPQSYVSFEAALQYHGMFDQLLGSVTSVSLKQRTLAVLEGIQYRYIKTSDKYFYGWEGISIDGHASKIATAEKALIDMIQFHRTSLAISLVAEKLTVSHHNIDFKRLYAFLLKANLTTLRIFGILLDVQGIDTEKLWARSRRSTAASRMSNQSNDYNARWRLYHDASLMETVATHVKAYVY